MTAVEVSKFGKDHWSLLGYVESCCVDGRDGVGALAFNRMRCNNLTHPLLGASHSWRQAWGTRLKGYFELKGRDDLAVASGSGLQLLDHDDWDCLDDLAAQGFVDILSLANGRVTMTEQGQAVAAALRAHKAQGGMFATFEYAPEPQGVPAAVTVAAQS